LPLMESGAGKRLGTEQMALACASHNGAAIHTDKVHKWLSDLNLSEADLRCGAHMPKDEDAHNALIKTDASPCQIHNNCSGKHAGFLTLTQHMKAGPEYNDPQHPLQQAIRASFEEVTQTPNMGHAIDGCSAPNFASTLEGMARAMAKFASAQGEDARTSAMIKLRNAMMTHQLMRACSEPVALKTGAEGFFVAILPNQKLGVALKVADGATRAADCAIAALLVRLGVLDPAHPNARKFMNAPVTSCNGLQTGWIKPAAKLMGHG